MNNVAAVMAQLVDIRNLGTEKCVKLTLHVPAEQAGIVIDAFGWPTAVAPVPVAIARLNESKRDHPSALAHGEAEAHKVASVSPSPKLVQQVGALCASIGFQSFLKAIHPERWRLLNEGTDTERAAVIVRSLCQVKSRRDILPDTAAARAWRDVLGQYKAWQLEDVIVP